MRDDDVRNRSIVDVCDYGILTHLYAFLISCPVRGSDLIADNMDCSEKFQFQVFQPINRELDGKLQIMIPTRFIVHLITRASHSVCVGLGVVRPSCSKKQVDG